MYKELKEAIERDKKREEDYVREEEKKAKSGHRKSICGDSPNDDRIDL